MLLHIIIAIYKRCYTL